MVAQSCLLCPTDDTGQGGPTFRLSKNPSSLAPLLQKQSCPKACPSESLGPSQAWGSMPLARDHHNVGSMASMWRRCKSGAVPWKSLQLLCDPPSLWGIYGCRICANSLRSLKNLLFQAMKGLTGSLAGVLVEAIFSAHSTV